VPHRDSAPASAGAGASEQQSSDREPSTDEIRERAASGFAVVASWGLLNLIVAFLGNIALARILTPRDFGIFAIGSTVLLMTAAFTEGGLGSGLIRRPVSPTTAELRTLAGLQLAVTSAVSFAIVLVASSFGSTGLVVAAMSAALPLASLQSPGRVVLNRTLHMRAVSAVEAAAVVVSYAWSITGAAVGLGVWALATGAIVRSTSGSLAMAVVPGGGLYRPSLRGWREFLPLMRFGVRFQAAWLVIVVRDQLVNVAIGAVGGVRALGLWSLVTRLMLVPSTVPEALSRVVYPTFSRTLEAGEIPRPAIERVARLSATAAALTFPPFVSASIGLVPTVFGEQWRDVAWVLPVATMGLFLATSILSVGVSYLFAADQPGRVLRATATGALLWVATTAVLVPALGVLAGGVGWVIGIAGESALIVLALRRTASTNVLPAIAVPSGVAVVAAGVGLVAAVLLEPNLAGSVVAGGLSFALAAGGLALLDRRELFNFLAVGRRSVRGALSR
jgi:O-antigen/teichoic acid export membrane protein